MILQLRLPPVALERLGGDVFVHFFEDSHGTHIAARSPDSTAAGGAFEYWGCSATCCNQRFPLALRFFALERVAFRSRSRQARQRRKLSARLAATLHRQPDLQLVTNSINREAYAGPTLRPLPSLGIISSRIARLVEWRTRFTNVCFGSASLSGWIGIRPSGTAKNEATRSGSPRSHDSTSRTAIRKHIFGAGLASRRLFNGGAHSSSSRSVTTSQGAYWAALL